MKASTLPVWLRTWSVRLGHDLIWLGVAVLFCAVELAVLAGEIRPARLMRWRRAVSARRAMTTLPAAEVAAQG